MIRRVENFLCFAALVLVACGGGSRSAAWGETEPESEAPPSSAQAAARSGPAGPAPVCETPHFLEVKLGTGRAMPEKKSVRSVHLIEGLSSRKHFDDADLARMLDTAAPLDSCDPTVAEFQYAPDGVVAVELSDGTKLRLQLFTSARAALIWPDGTGVLFDFGDAAPWLSKEAQPFLRRDFQHDGDCRAEHSRPHRIVYSPEPNADTSATMKQLGATCARLPVPKSPSPSRESSWCCA